MASILLIYWTNRQRQVFRETGGKAMLWWPYPPRSQTVEYTVQNSGHMGGGGERGASAAGQAQAHGHGATPRASRTHSSQDTRVLFVRSLLQPWSFDPLEHHEHRVQVQNGTIHARLRLAVNLGDLRGALAREDHRRRNHCLPSARVKGDLVACAPVCSYWFLAPASQK